MNKLRMLALTALAAATVGIGALAAAPSASAMPPRTVDCGELKIRMNAALDLATLYYYIGDRVHGDYYRGQWYAYTDMYMDYC